MNDDSRLDDPTIPGDDRLFRRVPPTQLFREEDGTLRPSSAVFKALELSVNIESLMVLQGRPPVDTLRGYPGDFLTAITAARVRLHHHPIVKDTAPPNDPAHGIILGKKKNSFANDMTRNHEWVVAPTE